MRKRSFRSANTRKLPGSGSRLYGRADSGRAHEPDMEADTNGVEDRGERPALMEPMRISEASRHRAHLTDLAVELAEASAGLRRSLPDAMVASLAKLVRSMNCYYSNLIEGHDTHPVEIENALNEDYSADPDKRDLQLEAKAYIAVQEWIDTVDLQEPLPSKATLQAIHHRFCEQLPEIMLWVEHPGTGKLLPVVPGELRQHDVQVGRHVPVSPGAIDRFLNRFADAYARTGKTDSILVAAAAHHRLLWIHPFLDGNGRVARLMTHALLGRALDTGNIWSAARGLARSEAKYKEMLSGCDAPRRNDLDGGGTLSEEALANFTAFFLETCLDQVRFMERLVEPNQLRERVSAWAAQAIGANQLARGADILVDALLYRGQLERGEVPRLLGVSERHARRVVQSLFHQGVVHATSSRAPLHLAFPASLAPHWMPGLFPDVPTA